MTKHDTWVQLVLESPYQKILHLFPEGKIPVRDPFPITRTRDSLKMVTLIDNDRLTTDQFDSLVDLFAQKHNISPEIISQESRNDGGFKISCEWIISCECGPEGIARCVELIDFIESNSREKPSIEATEDFINSHYSRWILGNQQPPAIKSIKDVDERLRTKEIEAAIAKNQTLLTLANTFMGGLNKPSQKPKEIIQIYNAITLYLANPDGSKSETRMAMFSRPSDWGHPRWHYELLRLEWEQEDKIIIYYAHCWTNIKLERHKYPQLFAGFITMMPTSGKPPQVCGRDFLSPNDIWVPQWGDKPPIAPSDEPEDYWEYTDLDLN